MSKPTRSAIVVAILIILGVGVLVLIGSSSLFVMRHVAIEPGTTASAQHAFAQAREPFSGRTPMIEIGADGSIRKHDAAGSSTHVPLTTLHVLAWDADRERLVTANIPFWALRLKSSMPGMRTEVPLWVLALQGDRSDPSGMRADGPMLSLEDVERFGPGLIIDAELSRGRRVLMWAE